MVSAALGLITQAAAASGMWNRLYTASSQASTGPQTTLEPEKHLMNFQLEAEGSI